MNDIQYRVLVRPEFGRPPGHSQLERGTTMSEHGTPSSVEIFPGWYIAFQQKAIGALPRPPLLTQDRAERWTTDGEGLTRLLLGSTELPMDPSSHAKGIVKTVAVQIGGGRTTDMIVKAAADKGNKNRCSFVHHAIVQANMPSGNGRLRTSVLEWGEFDHDPYTDEVCDWINEPGYGHPTYEDGLRFQEDDPEAQRERSRIVIPENPWCVARGFPYALMLWGRAGVRLLDLSRCGPRDQWARSRLFARRKYSAV